MRPLSSSLATSPSSTTTAAAAAHAAPHSPWHSPVPYLFGGLAAMLGLIAFALLILACSYWKLSGSLEIGENERDGSDSGNPEKGSGDAMKGNNHVYEEKIVVIMAGDEKPTFLATPMSSRASSFGDNKSNSSKDDEKTEYSDDDKSKQQQEELERSGGSAQFERGVNGLWMSAVSKNPFIWREFIDDALVTAFFAIQCEQNSLIVNALVTAFFASQCE
ncbi:hypothetical protein Sjap_010683 [Stephania japonica]|uniref:Uncharacterized protein n=1 Tax=Stephania japonica TaxID=461633 RepID=A0AAP0P7D0_9MAGN